MSLIRLALRISAAMALTDRTIAGGRVLDSVVAPVNELKSEQMKPFIVVYTDDEDLLITGRDLLAPSGTLDLVIDTVVASAVEVDGETTLEIAGTSEKREVVLDILNRQIVRALMGGETEWSTIFKCLTVKFGQVLSRRGSSEDEGVKYSARQTVYQVETLSEPEYGKPINEDHPLVAFLTALRTVPGQETIADWVEAEIKGEDLEDWEQLRVALGLTDDEVQGIGIGPYNIGEDADEMTVIVLDDGSTETIIDEDTEIT